MYFSSSCLFHYTKSVETLTSILKNGFYTNYCIEKFLGHKLLIVEELKKYGMDVSSFDIDEIAIPMVSFCNIRLSQVNQHMQKYGHFGIGLSDEWGNQNGVSPIIYVDTRRSSLKYILNSMYISIIQHNAWLLNHNLHEKAISNNALKYFLLLSCLVKPIKGYEYNNEKNEFNCRETYFYDEKEWRFLPLINTGSVTGEIKQFLIKKDLELIQEQNKYVQSYYPLKFELADIEHIIVKEEKDIDNIVQCINEINASESEKIKAYTKIITSEQINKNF